MSTESKFDQLFTLVPERACGDCISCCKIPAIDSPTLKKPADAMCPNCTNPGCRAYDTRPDVCRAWFCLWRRLDSLPAEMRPDLGKVMLSVEFSNAPDHVFEKAYFLCRALEGPENFQAPGVVAALKFLVTEFDLPVWAAFQGRKTLVYPPPFMVQEILDPSSAESEAEADEARQWLAGYEDRASLLRSRQKTFNAGFLPIRAVL